MMLHAAYFSLRRHNSLIRTICTILLPHMDVWWPAIHARVQVIFTSDDTIEGTGFTATYSEFISDGSVACSDPEQQRVMYLESRPAFGVACKAETQIKTCSNGAWGAWNGTFVQESCAFACDNGHMDGDTEVKLLYNAARMPHGSLCQGMARSRLCSNGNFGSWYDPEYGTDYFQAYVHAACFIDCPSVGLDFTANETVQGAMVYAFRFNNAAPKEGQMCEGKWVHKRCMAVSEAKHILGWHPSATWSDPEFVHTACAASCLAADQTTIPHGGLESRVVYRFESTGSSDEGVDPCNLHANQMVQARTCENGTFAYWEPAAGEDRKDPRDFQYETCTAGCGPGILDGDMVNITR